MSSNFKGLYSFKLHTYVTYLSLVQQLSCVFIHGPDVLSHCDEIPSSQFTGQMKAAKYHIIWIIWYDSYGWTLLAGWWGFVKSYVRELHVWKGVNENQPVFFNLIGKFSTNTTNFCYGYSLGHNSYHIGGFCL